MTETDHLCMWCGCQTSIFDNRHAHKYRTQCIAALTAKNDVLQDKINKLKTFVKTYDTWNSRWNLEPQGINWNKLREARKELDK